jgi:haloacetate dehalogenase
MLEEGFTYRTIATPPRARTSPWAAQGQPLLLLHGYPQTHLAWHRVAPALAKELTVIAPDLRGYGESRVVDGNAGPASFSKRVMAID